jgi:glycosyltransferase involved in cell wall biosynthesis
MLSEMEHYIAIFDHTEAAMQSPCDFTNLNVLLPRQLWRATKALKQIIASFQPNIIHSHLYWANIVSRFAAPPKLPLIQSYHSDLYNPTNVAQFSTKMKWFDKITYRDRMHLVFVSDTLQREIAPVLSATSNLHTLYNFVNEKFINSSFTAKNNTPIKIATVGNLRKEKNHAFLINAMEFLPECELYIFGSGPEENKLLELIYGKKLENVFLKGTSTNVPSELVEMDVFIMPSTHEGFGIALAEAMTMGMPCIVSDIDVFRELGEDSVKYFQLKNMDSIVDAIRSMNDYKTRLKFSEKSKIISKKFRPETYKSRLLDIYSKILDRQ